jgi:uncharacterized integral membrane protein
MIRKIVTVFILVPLAILFIGFAVANRESVLISFDPFNAATPENSVRLPLFIIILLLLMIGVLIGGAAAWLGQGKWRRAARRLDAENRELHAELYELRRQADARARVAIPPPETAHLRSPV